MPCFACSAPRLVGAWIYARVARARAPSAVAAPATETLAADEAAARVMVAGEATPTADPWAEHSMKLRLVCVVTLQWRSNVAAGARHVGVVSDPESTWPVAVPAARHVAGVAAVVAVPVVQHK